MKTYNTFKTFVFGTLAALALLAFATTTVFAQDDQPSFEAGPYIWNLGLSAGFLSTTTAQPSGSANPNDYWAQERYYEAMNYRTGIKINSLNLYGERNGKSGFFDELYVNADGLGDPYTTASIRMRQFNAFDFKVDYRNMKYFMNRNDSIYTGLHKFDESRDFLNASLGIDLSNDINVKLMMNSTGHSGNFTQTVSPFIDGGEEIGGGNGKSDGSFGTYARGNFYWINSPANDRTNEYKLQGTFKIADQTAFTLGGGIRQFNQTIEYTTLSDTSLTYYTAKGVVNWAGVFAGFPNSPATISKANTNPLNSYDWKETRKGSAPLAYFELVTRPIDKLSITANVNYEKTDAAGTTVDGKLDGWMPSAAASLGGPKTSQARNIIYTAAAENNSTYSMLLASLNLTGTITDEISATALYRMTSTNLESDGSIHGNLLTNDSAAGGTPAHQLYDKTFDSKITNKVSQQLIQAFVNITPINMLNLRVGINYNMRSPEYDRAIDGVEDSASNTNMSRETKGLGEFFSFWYRPIHEIKLSGSVTNTDAKSYIHGTTTQVDAPIRIEPEKMLNYKVGIDFDPMSDLRVNVHYSGFNGSSDLLNMLPLVQQYNPELTSKMSSIAGTISYTLLRHTTIAVTGEYRTNDFVIPASYTRGQVDPTPLYGDSLTINVEQHTKDLSIDASIISSPIPELHLMVGYSMIDSKEGSYVTPDTKTGIAPDLVRIGGPYTWSLIHASASYDITKNIGVMVDYQLAQQKEEAIYDATVNYAGVVNNYKASLIRGSVYIHL